MPSMVPAEYEQSVLRGVGRLMSGKHLPPIGVHVGPKQAVGKGVFVQPEKV